MGDHFKESACTVAELVRRYLQHSETDGTHCPASRRERVRTLDEFVAHFGAANASDLRAFHLTDWIVEHADWKSVSTRRARANYVKAVFAWAARDGRIDANPFASVRYAEADRRPELPDEALSRVCNVATKEFERAARFLRFTGCRLSDLCRATWDQMDLERGIWTIHVHKSMKKTKRPIVRALTPEAVEILLLIRAERKADPIFVNTRGRPWTKDNMGQYLRSLKYRYGIDTEATLHGIRHQMATAAIASGASIKLVSMQLGHSSVSITERWYCHVDPAKHIDAIRAAAQLGIPKL